MGPFIRDLEEREVTSGGGGCEGCDGNPGGEVGDGLAWPLGGADGLAGVGGGLGDGVALDGVELGEVMLEHSPLR